MYSLESTHRILMSILNIQYHDKMTKFPQIFVLLEKVPRDSKTSSN